MVEVAQQEISRRTLLRSVGLASVAVAGGGLLQACTPGGKDGNSGGAKVLNLAFNRDLVTIDNKTNQYDSVVTVTQAVRQGLVGLDSNFDVTNILSQSFTSTA